jgi:hypothetical protein
MKYKNTSIKNKKYKMELELKIDDDYLNSEELSFRNKLISILNQIE